MEIAKNLVLASTSVYRKALLQQLGLPFQTAKPLFDEEEFKKTADFTELAKNPQSLAEALAFFKAESLKHPSHVVIGADQLVAHRGQILGKPHTRNNAIEQLFALQGSEHQLITAVCVCVENTAIPLLDKTRLWMKPLSRLQLTRYVDLDQPLDCAGSYKIEKHGMMLFEKIESQDFTAIQGLPLLALSRILNQSGFSIP